LISKKTNNSKTRTRKKSFLGAVEIKVIKYFFGFRKIIKNNGFKIIMKIVKIWSLLLILIAFKRKFDLGIFCRQEKNPNVETSNR